VIHQISHNQRSWMSAVASVTGGGTFEAGGVTCVHQPLPLGELLVPFPERPPGAGVVERARQLGSGRVGCWAAAPDAALDAALRELGFAPGWEPHWMSAPAKPAPPDPRVAEAQDVPEYDDYGRRLLSLTREPHSFLFVAREEGRFAGHAWLHVAGGVGGLYDVFVPEDFRHRGLGSALSRAAIAQAAALGIHTVTVNAEAEQLYESLGFRSLGHGQTWWRHRV
jgi:GNAT superfamily N-acetyltransferase